MVVDKLLAVDPSLTCSGWALFEVRTKSLLGIGSIRTLGPEFPMAVRLNRLQDNIDVVLEQLDLKSGDILICEDATSVKDPSAVAKLERVRGIFETLARSYGVTVPGRIHPRTVQHELLGLKGKQLSREAVKAAARHAVSNLFGHSLQKINFDTSVQHMVKCQDIIDAILVGSVSLTRIEAANRAELSLEEYFHSFEKVASKRRVVGGNL